MKPGELANLTGYSRKQIRRLAELGKIPHTKFRSPTTHRMTGHVFFEDKPALREWIEIANAKRKVSGLRWRAGERRRAARSLTLIEGLGQLDLAMGSLSRIRGGIDKISTREEREHIALTLRKLADKFAKPPK